MTEQLGYGRAIDEDEERQLIQAASQGFAFPVAKAVAYYERIGMDNVRVVRRGGRVVGTAAFYPVGQWFGGGRVPSGAVAAVAVPPHERAAGVARTMMRRLLEEMREGGFPLSSLYASTAHLYRRVGYEVAGDHVTYSIPCESVTTRNRDVEMWPFDPVDHDLMRPMYEARASREAGHLDRNEGLWTQIAPGRRGEKLYAYAFGARSSPEGYFIYAHDLSEPFKVRIRDMALLTAGAVRRFWTFVGDLDSIVRTVQWLGPASDPILMSLPEQSWKVVESERWLLRVVHARRALELRGYEPSLRAELHLDVRDEVLAANSGRHVLRVADGVGELVEGGDGALRVGCRGLAALYSGLHSAEELQRQGALEGEAGVLRTASLLFAGPRPWMPDDF
ncbi:MAG TPA: GNAT family N-acetyltransferase [Myxococcota bacterium]|nr:GNAT family N-acetyltransferase [Myxococcota bacterium]